MEKILKSLLAFMIAKIVSLMCLTSCVTFNEYYQYKIEDTTNWKDDTRDKYFS